MYQILKMQQKDAVVIADNWKYDGEYSFYNMTEDPEDYEEIISPERRKDNYYSVFENKILIGFFCFFEDGNFIEIGLGLKPCLTGQGKGRRFLNEILLFIRNKNSNKRVRLSVAKFNKRAIKLYEKVGFVKSKEKKIRSNGGIYDFVIMEK